MERQIKFIKDYSPNAAVYVLNGTQAVADEWEEEGLTTITFDSAVSKNGSKQLDVNSAAITGYTKDI